MAKITAVYNKGVRSNIVCADSRNIGQSEKGKKEKEKKRRERTLGQQEKEREERNNTEDMDEPGIIMSSISQPYEGLFEEESIEKCGNESFSPCELRCADGKKAETDALEKAERNDTEGNDIGGIMDDISQPYLDLFEEENIEECGNESFSSCELQCTDDEEAKIETVENAERNNTEDMDEPGIIMNNISQPYEGLFEEENKQEKEHRKAAGSKNQKKAEKIKTDEGHQENVKQVLQKLLQQNLILCINGKNLFLKKNGIYKSISFSTEAEIMHLKMLLREHHRELKPSEYKVFLRELKTEPDIWVENIERKDGLYNIYFCGGQVLYGVEGEFNDYMVQGQIHMKRKSFTEGITVFVKECCELDKSEQAGSSELFYAYQEFMNEMPDYFIAKQKQFVSFLKKECGLLSGSTGKIRVLKGICLKVSCPC